MNKEQFIKKLNKKYKERQLADGRQPIHKSVGSCQLLALVDLMYEVANADTASKD